MTVRDSERRGTNDPAVHGDATETGRYGLVRQGEAVQTPATFADWVGMSVVAVVAFVADWITKAIATDQLVLGESHSILPFLDLQRIHNTGVAFSRLSGRQSIVMALTIVAVTWILIYFRRSGGRHRYVPPGIGLLVGGAIGNFVDRLRHGYVTDFIHVSHWPVFNLADVFITIGVATLLLGLLRHEHRTRLDTA